MTRGRERAGRRQGPVSGHLILVAWGLQLLPSCGHFGRVLTWPQCRQRQFCKSVSHLSAVEDHMRSLLRSAAALALVFAAVTPAAAQQPVPAGHIKTVSGGAFLVRAGSTTAVKAGDSIFAPDVLRTAADGAVGVTLKDDTRISLGPSSELRLERYVYAPGEGGLGMVLNFVHGVGVYVSGGMAKLAPDSIRLETPAAIIGVRGTTVAVH